MWRSVEFPTESGFRGEKILSWREWYGVLLYRVELIQRCVPNSRGPNHAREVSHAESVRSSEKKGAACS